MRRARYGNGGPEGPGQLAEIMQDNPADIPADRPIRGSGESDGLGPGHCG